MTASGSWSSGNFPLSYDNFHLAEQIFYLFGCARGDHFTNIGVTSVFGMKGVSKINAFKMAGVIELVSKTRRQENYISVYRFKPAFVERMRRLATAEHLSGHTKEECA